MELTGQSKALIEKHVASIEWIRDALLGMDALAKPVMGIRDWDDAVIINIGGKKVIASTDGPYKKRLVTKSALIHASTDVIVKGGKPLFALDNLSGPEDDIKEMLFALKKQALGIELPILGGNTMPVEGEPLCSLTVIGELILDEPIRDSGAKKGDVLMVLGEPIWGEMDERIRKAKVLFKAWNSILEAGIVIHAAKDVTKGGLVSSVYEVCTKSKVDYSLEKNIPYSLTRNLDNFLISISEKNVSKIEKICSKNKCPAVRVGSVF